MCLDGLLPQEFFTAVHPVYKTPYKVTILTGVCVALTAALIPLSVLVELVSMGTLMAFAFVNISVVLLRKYQPNLRRPFLCPCMPYLPISGAAICFMLMISLPSANWVRLFVWFFIGEDMHSLVC
jgi:APA family basic amino acid/polyamine antiporter